MTTSSTAIFIPFMTRELRMGGQALYYGMNALSHNVIMADRKKLKSANGLYLGSTGSGKSFAAKRELLNVFLATNDRIVIVDPMGEYVPLARRLGDQAQVIEISPDSPHHLNPMDVELNMTAGESPLSMKADFLLSLCELVVGGKEGLQPIEKTVIDRCVRLVYREQALGIATERTPLLKKGKDDSNSVKNQRDLLNDFYHKHIDEFESTSEYVDDGHTGTDANRENFQRLLADVMSGKINCVVVKDLSRFARNYSDAGSLIDNLFVQMGVRFISLAENVDSFTNPDSVSSIIVPITNVMNDQYCYQTSKKIRQVFDYKRRNGQYIGSFAPYGYIKDPKDKHQLIVDPEAAEIVKLIYNMTLQGETRRAIVYHLNDHGIPSPTTYRKNKGLPYSCSVSDNPMWGDRVLKNILTNPIYTGDLVQGRRRVKSYEIHEIEAVPEEEWVRVADTHEAIIDRETFDKVQALLKRDTRTAPRKKELHLFSGFLRCADCGKSITRSQSGKNVYYACSTYKYRSRAACSMHSIKHERLEAAVLFGIQYQVHLAVSYSEAIARINSAPIKKSQSFRLDDLITAKERELAKITRYKQSL